jgi:hypothetical protein
MDQRVAVGMRNRSAFRFDSHPTQNQWPSHDQTMCVSANANTKHINTTEQGLERKRPRLHSD